LVRAYFLVVSAGVARVVEEVSAQFGKKPTPGDFEPATWLLARIGWANSAADLIGARWTIERAARDVAAFFERYDVFVSSTTAQPPARVGELSPSASETWQAKLVGTLPVRALLDLALDKMAEGKLAYTPNTQLFNQTGQPAISLPLATSGEGLPLGVQFVGRFGDEATLFRLAAQLEQAAPWADRRPRPPA
jgi:amidase